VLVYLIANPRYGFWEWLITDESKESCLPVPPRETLLERPPIKRNNLHDRSMEAIKILLSFYCIRVFCKRFSVTFFIIKLTTANFLLKFYLKEVLDNYSHAHSSQLKNHVGIDLICNRPSKKVLWDFQLYGAKYKI